MKSVTVNLPADVKNRVHTVTFSDNPETMKLDAFVQKLDTKGWAVQGVVFKVCLYDGTYAKPSDCPAAKLKKTWYLKSDNDGKVKFNENNVASGYKSDAFYTWNNKIVVPIGCTLTYQEVKAPKKYVVDNTVNVWSTTNQKIELKSFYNDITPCKIKLKKYDKDGKTPLSNVSFEITFVKESEAYKENKFQSYTPTLKQGETKTLTTDKNGYVEIGNLDQGEYQIVETSTKAGNTLLKDPINITLPITMTDKDAKRLSAATDNGQFDEGYTNKWYFYEATYEITNNAKFGMSLTGSNGIWMYGFIGLGMAAMAGFGIVLYDKNNKKRKRHKRK